MVKTDLASLVNATVVDSHYLLHQVAAGYQYVEDINAAFRKDNTYTLFRAEDATAWIVFTCVFVVLIIFDNAVLHRNNKALSITTALIYTLFWIACATAFCGYVAFRNGHSAAYNWMSGYMLEWMLSFDNLFVFHLIFTSYATPDHLKHRPLFLGICGAVFFRLVFLFIGEYLMHAMFFTHILFGAFLVWTGFKSAMVDDDDEDDPAQNPLVQWLSRTVSFVSAYDSQGAFFVRVPLDDSGRVVLPPGIRRGSSIDIENANESSGYGTVEFNSQLPRGTRYQWRATMLFLVVICLEISDILFAVDSVSAIVAQVNDLFLAYTSAIFAMLGLRATFFIIDVLVKLFTLLKYGVAAVLVFIGIKLILSKMYTVPPGLVCIVLFITLASSMVASVIYDHYLRVYGDAADALEEIARAEKKDLQGSAQ